MAAFGLFMAKDSRLRLGIEFGEGEATAQRLCSGSASASARYARRDLRYACTEPLCGGAVSRILDQFGVLITCPIQKGDGARTQC